MTATTVSLAAPLSGVIVPLERVPDPVFSGKIVGDGVSIDPTTSELLAPCDGTVQHVHAANHALTLLTPEGLEVMVHIGLDTVDLKGEGFTLEVRQGDTVARGDRLIRFDADYVATHARSLLTQIVITNGERVNSYAPASGIVTAAQDVCLELALAQVSGDTEKVAGATVTSDAIVIRNETGLHARPAALLATLAKSFAGEVHLRKGEARANAKSVVGVMSLNVSKGDKIHIVATGPDARSAVDRLAEAITAGLGEEHGAAAPRGAAEPQMAAAPVAPSSDPRIIAGVAASPGVAVGQVSQVRAREFDVDQDARGTPHDERRALDEAIDQAHLQLSGLRGSVQRRADSEQADIFGAHAELLEDPELLDIAQSAIDKGKSAAFAWQLAYRTCADRLARLGNELLAARASDLRDVGARVLRLLLGESDAGPVTTADNAILIAEDLTPSDTASLDTSRVLGFATVAGGASSHVAILAHALGIPAVAGIEPRALAIEDGTTVVLDGGRGQLRLEPSANEIERVRQHQADVARRQREDIANAHLGATTSDGCRIEVAANVGGLDDAHKGVTFGADGVGLLRTEFLFLDRASAPNEDEQAQVYGDIAAAMGSDRTVIIRTLDVGGDKPLPYLPMAPEENPFLGERGIRVGLARPELLRTQLRAILRASNRGNVRIMFPMISSLDELREVKAWLEEERLQMDAAPVEVGIMIEVPAAAVMARQFAKEVDFFSVGTNDLTQYTLAMDRGHPRLAPLCDGLHPAVLKLIDLSVQGAREHGAWVGVCGGIASDALAVPLLIGLGVTELSASVPAIPGIKAQVRTLNLAACRELAARALAADTAADVRSLVARTE